MFATGLIRTVNATHGRSVKDRQRNIPIKTSRKRYVRSKTTEDRQLEQFSGAQEHHLHQNKTQESRHSAHARQDRHEQIRQIADVFAEIYEELYTSTTTTYDHEDSHKQSQRTMMPFTMQKIDEAINQLKKTKASDTRGVNTEMIRQQKSQKNTCCVCTTKSSSQARHPPDSTIKVIQKLKPVTLTRLPTHLLCPILCKLFSQLLFRRLQPTLGAHKSDDQANFRAGHFTTDHLYTF